MNVLKKIALINLALLGFLGVSQVHAMSVTDCSPVEVVHIDSGPTERVHIKCSVETVPGIWFFAVPASEIEKASSFSSLGASALGNGLIIDVTYDENKDASIFGCDFSNCREAENFVLR